MNYIADGTRPAGERIVYAEIGGAPLDPNTSYSIATTDFLTAGGDGFQMFTSYPVLLETGELLSDIAMDFIESKGTGVYEEFTPRFIISDQPIDDASLHQILEGKSINKLNVEDEQKQYLVNRGEPFTSLLEDLEEQENNLQSLGDDLIASFADLSSSPTQAASGITGLEARLAAKEKQLASKEMRVSTSSIPLPDHLKSLNRALRIGESYQESVNKNNRLKADFQMENEELEEKGIDEEKQFFVGQGGQPLPDTATTIWSVGLVGLVALTGGVVTGRMKKDEEGIK